MQNHYEFNVSMNGKHLFATHERSARDEFSAKKISTELNKRFPAEEGFIVTCTLWEGAGHKVEFGGKTSTASKDRYFTHRHGFSCRTQCLILKPCGDVIGLMLDGSIQGRPYYNKSICEAYGEEGSWVEFQPRGE